MTHFAQTLTRASRSKYFRTWVVMTVLGHIAGVVLLVGPLILLSRSALYETFLSWQRIPHIFTLLGGLGALFISAFQWWVLRRQFRKAYWWIVATVLSTYLGIAVAGGFVGYMLDVFSDPAVWAIAPFFQSLTLRSWLTQLMQALILGIAQWLFFRGKVKGAAWWIVAVVVANVLIALLSVVGPQWNAIDVGVAGDNTRIAMYYLYGQLMGLIGAVIYSAIPGVVLLWFIEQKEAHGNVV